VVLTFAGATEDQFRLLPDGSPGGSVDPDSAVGILQAFHEAHPWEWPLRATFFIPPGDAGRPAFGQSELASRKIELLASWGMEAAGQVAEGVDLSQLSPEDVQRELARPHAYVAGLYPGYDIFSLDIPGGSYPDDKTLLAEGTLGADPYTYGAVVGADVALAPSFLSPDFDPLNLPRVPATQDSLDRWLRDAHRVGIGYVSPGE
jgi:hypothetical protein